MTPPNRLYSHFDLDKWASIGQALPVELELNFDPKSLDSSDRRCILHIVIRNNRTQSLVINQRRPLRRPTPGDVDMLPRICLRRHDNELPVLQYSLDLFYRAELTLRAQQRGQNKHGMVFDEDNIAADAGFIEIPHGMRDDLAIYLQQA